MEETIRRKSCELLDRDGVELCTGVAEITIQQDIDSKLYNWQGTITVNGASGIDNLHIRQARLVLDNGRAANIVVSHSRSPSILMFKGSSDHE